MGAQGGVKEDLMDGVVPKGPARARQEKEVEPGSANI